MKRTFASSLVAGILLLALVQHHSVTSARYFDRSTVAIESVEDAVALETDAVPNSSADKKGGNGFVHALGAPFRAIGRLFGAGKKNDQKLSRISDKDAKKFGTTLATRIKDSETQTPEPQPTSLVGRIVVPSCASPRPRWIVLRRLLRGRPSVAHGTVADCLVQPRLRPRRGRRPHDTSSPCVRCRGR